MMAGPGLQALQAPRDRPVQWAPKALGAQQVRKVRGSS